MTEDYSAHYRRFHDEGEVHAIEMAEWLGQYLKNDLPSDRSMSVLDVGCGFGFALRAIRSAGFEDVRGIESSEHQAKVARRSGLNVEVVADTPAFLNLHSECFGLILLMDVLEHIPVDKQIGLLRAIRRALLSNGRLILTVPNANSPLAMRWRYIDFTHCASFTEHSLFFALNAAGFTEIKIDNTKGIGAFPKKWWRREQRANLRKWLVRFGWSQVFKAELHPSESIVDLSFELNLKAIAMNNVISIGTDGTSIIH